MASVKPRPNKDGSISYLITVSLGRDAEGKKQIETTTFVPKSKAPTKAKKEAEAFAVEYERQVKSGDIVSADKVTFSEFVKIWEDNWLPAKTKTVQENYKSVLSSRVIPHIGKMKITSIRATHIDKILKSEQSEGKAPSTIRMTFAVMNSVFKYAMKKQYIRENPMLRCDDLPSVSMKTGSDLHFFTLEQAKTFLHSALVQAYDHDVRSHQRTLNKTGVIYQVPAYSESKFINFQWRVYFTIAIYGGFRRGEMCALTWRDIDFDKHTISITKAIAGTKDGQIVKDPKTSAGIREIVLPSECFILLKQWKRKQLSMCLEMGSAWKGHREVRKDGKTVDCFDDNTIFIQIDSGLPIHLSTPGHKFHEIIDMFNATCERDEDKLPHIRLHDLRHTSATLLLSRNADIETVARRLGHSKASVTLDIYGHALPENDRQAANALEAMFG